MFGMYKLTVQLFLDELPFNFVHYSFFLFIFSVYGTGSIITAGTWNFSGVE